MLSVQRCPLRQDVRSDDRPADAIKSVVQVQLDWLSAEAARDYHIIDTIITTTTPNNDASYNTTL
ncbi:MAG: hypothetical protein O7G88_04835 [bacterium]|nr:hypothetical protein [bacterium]